MTSSFILGGHETNKRKEGRNRWKKMKRQKKMKRCVKAEHVEKGWPSGTEELSVMYLYISMVNNNNLLIKQTNIPKPKKKVRWEKGKRKKNIDVFLCKKRQNRKKKIANIFFFFLFLASLLFDLCPWRNKQRCWRTLVCKYPKYNYFL